MPQFTTVIVGTDFSPASLCAVREAGRIARWNKAPLLVTHIVDPERIESIQDFENISTDDILTRAKASLEEIVAEQLNGSEGVTTHVSLGHPFQALAAMAARHSDALLVLGAHGFREDRRSTGTVAAKCVRKAPGPVLLVRKEQDQPFRKIVACIDFSPNSLEAAGIGARIALQDDAVLELIHVHLPPWQQPTAVQYNLTAAPDAEYRRQYVELLEERLQGVAADLEADHPGLNVTSCLVERSHPAYGVVDHLNETKADLAVMGTRGRTGFKALLLGTTAERVVHDSPCSVLALKPAEFSYPID